MVSPFLICMALVVAPLLLVEGGKILVFPVDGSHWVNMKLLIKELHGKGHEITVVRLSNSWYIEEESPHYISITIHPPNDSGIMDEDNFETFLARMLEIQRGGHSFMSFLSFQWEMITVLSKMHKDTSHIVVDIFENERLMQELQESQYDVVLTDPGLPGGVLLAHRLQLPLVYNVRWITGGEAHFVAAPSPMSYVPAPGSHLSCNMTFTERTKNMLFYVLNFFIDTYMVSSHYDEICRQYFGPDVYFYHLLQSADIWLVRVDFVFEFPRPTMPNMVYIGGFQCKAAKALPLHLEEFVQSAGEHGVIIMSLGTLVKALPFEITSEIAAAFAQLPQKVIWRYEGDVAPNIGNNTLLVKWLPQNDLLGHPKVKVFVSHGGTNGVYEAIYHAVPLVGIPLLFDQFENLMRLETRGAAKVLDVTKMTRQSFLQALLDVIHKPSYRWNMQKLSNLHRDTPFSPLESAIFWIEYVIRHRGAPHLRTESYKLPWYAYHSFDVAVVLLSSWLVLISAVAGGLYFLCRMCWKRKPKLD